MPHCLITQNRFLYASRRILNEASARGIELEVLNPSTYSRDLTQQQSAGSRALLRFGPQSRADAIRVAEVLSALGAEVVNAPDAARGAASKVLSSAKLASAGIACLPSIVAQGDTPSKEAIASLGGYPLIAKREFGTQGEGVFLIENETAGLPMLTALIKEGPIILQPFVQEAGGSDMRYLVLDGQIVAGVARDGVAGDFRANFHRGATLMPWMDEEGAELAIAAANALGLRFAGVDLIQSADGMRVLEANASAGFRGVEEACGINVAGLLVDHFYA